MSSQLPAKLNNLLFIVGTLCLGAGGGYVFSLMQMPLAWMTGAMVFTTIASLSGAPLKSSQNIRSLVIPVLGLMLGSSFTPETVGGVEAWIPSLSSMILYVLVITIVVGTIMYRYVGMGPITAFFSATPGGLATMVIVGRDAGGDERQIALTHSVRVFITVLIIPLWFRIFEGYTPSGLSALGSIININLIDASVMVSCAIIGIYGGKFLRLPSAQLLGPMILSAVIHATGLTHAKPPVEILNISQLVIGTMVGARFSGIALTQVYRVLAAAVASTAFMVGFAAIIAIFLERATGLPFQVIWLAFAPGGLAEMTLISLSLNIDPAFVSTHHLLRVLFMVLISPILFQLLRKYLNITGDEPRKKP
jgi:membrane AbrB-like protein